MKFYPLLLTIIAISSVVRAEKFEFGSNEDLLRQCVEDYLSADSDSKIASAAKSLAEIAVHRFLNKSYLRNKLEEALKNMCFRIKSKKSYLFDDNKVPEQLKMSMRRALITCVERKNLPRFDHEPQVLADLLDYILVDWPIPLSEIISNRDGRSTLRRYAYASGVRLMAALRYFSMDYQIFRRELRRIWMRRAEEYFNARRTEFYYIRHRFTTNRNRMYSSETLEDIHTIDDVNSFNSRRLENFSFRNPVVRHRNSTSLSCPENEVYIKYSRYGVTSAENFFEVHVDRCYRIILFILELQLRGINTDEDDIYNGPIPIDVLPYLIQEMVWNYEAYRSYVTYLRQYFEQYPIEEFERFSSSCTIEELITQLTMSIARKNEFTTTIAITNTTSTTTETPNFEEGSKKGETRIQDYGKYLPPNKRFRMIFSEENQEDHRMDQNFDYYGYILLSDDFAQLNFFEENQLYFPELMIGLNLDGFTAAKNFLSGN